MIRITVLCVGKIKEAFYRDAVGEYQKRLSRYATLKIVEVADEKTKEEPSEAEVTQVLRAEGERLQKKIPENAFVCALDIAGKKTDSIGFAGMLHDQMNRGISHICFIIGGSLGIWEEIKQRSDLRLSFSDLTFPHQLMRVILLEQLYRGFRILHHEPYHK